MSLITGQTLGSYRISNRLGAGGMGEVWRATDTRLGREVALKVLPEGFADDPERHARFEREAKVLASLNHPHIAHLYALEHLEARADSRQPTAHGTSAYPGTSEAEAMRSGHGPRAPGHDVERAPRALHVLVMELVEGQGLDERISRGPIPIDEAMEVARQIAEALEAAHEAGIVHRDLKPANVMVKGDGTVKVLDFGLAKALDATASTSAPGLAHSPTLLHSPTITSEATQAGLILGTAAYMAPEQARGKQVDRRADIWAFGVVVFEMLAGRRLFSGEDVPDVLANVLKGEIDWGRLPAATPPEVRRLLHRCLERDPRVRLRDIGEARIALAAPAGAVAAQPAPPASRRRPAWALAGGAVLVAALAAALGYLLHPQAAPPPLLRVNLALPAGFSIDGDNASLALSPDGSRLAIAGALPGQRQQLWLRSLSREKLEPIANTGGATYPFWSPDGAWLGFFADGKLRKVPADGGPVQSLCAANEGRGGAWNRDGVIAFTPGPLDPLFTVPAAGGVPKQLTKLGREGESHRMPWFLPDGRRLLFALASTDFENGAICATDLDSGTVVTVTDERSEGRYLAPGLLAFVRDGQLLLQPFDAATLKAGGDPVPVADDVHFNVYRLTGLYSASDGGMMVYDTSPVVARSQMTWYDLEGAELGTLGEPAPIVDVQLSPDGRTVAATVRDRSFDIYLFEAERGTGSRLTFSGQPGAYPVWSRDGRAVAYSDGVGTVWRKLIDRSAEAEVLLRMEGAGTIATGASADGRMLALSVRSDAGSSDVALLPLAGDRTLEAFVATPANEYGATFSPDGAWALLTSDETGRPEVYAVPYPGPGGKWQISEAGGMRGWWIDGGRRIAYLATDTRLWAVDVARKSGTLVVGARRPLLGGRTAVGQLDFAPDGRRILQVVPLERTTSLSLVSDWRAALRRP